MIITPREDQVEAKQAVRDAYAVGKRRVAVSAPTGWGKTIFMSDVIRDARAKGSHVLLLAHTDELLEQARDKLCSVAPDLCNDIGFVRGAQDEYYAPIVVASVQTLGRPNRIRRLVESGIKFQIVFTDEAHHAAANTYQRIYENLGVFEDDTKTLMVGVTATPQRADEKDLSDTFEEIVFHRDLLWAIEKGLLVQPRGIRVQLQEFDPNELHVSGGDFKLGEAAEALSNADAPRHTVKAWLKHCRGRKTIVFTPTIASAEEMAAEFQAQGVEARNISGLDADGRKGLLADFAAGKIQVLCNAMVLTEGFDEPAVDCIVIARPTKSHILYKQMIGRGLRLFANPETGFVKQDCIVLDMAGATDRLDLLSVAKLTGMADQDVLPQEDVNQIIAEEGILSAMQAIQAEQVRQGRIVAKQVDLFNRKNINWVMAEVGFWSLGLGDKGDLVAKVNPLTSRWNLFRIFKVQIGERWDSKEQKYVPRYVKDIERLAEEVPMSLAMAQGEEYARKSGASKMFDKTAPWRQRPISEKQLLQLRKFKVNLPPCEFCGGVGDGCGECKYTATSMTRGEANDLLSARYAMRDLRKLARG